MIQSAFKIGRKLKSREKLVVRVLCRQSIIFQQVDGPHHAKSTVF